MKKNYLSVSLVLECDAVLNTRSINFDGNNADPRLLCAEDTYMMKT